MAAAASAAVLTVTAALVVVFDDRASDGDLETALDQLPQASVTASSSVPPLTLLGTSTPSTSASPTTSASPKASAGASPKSSATASAKVTSVAAKVSAGTRAGVVLDGRMMGGWYAGAGGTGVGDGSFASWLGQPLGVIGTWADASDEEQRTVSGLTATYSGWKGAIDIAVGGTVLGSGENYAAAAGGAYDARWREAAAVIASVRKGATGPTFVRPFHEFNGTWFREWQVTPGNVADFRRAFARYAGILRQALPEVYVVWSPNNGDHSGVPVEDYYPGDDVVDVVGPDYYDDGTTGATVDIAAWNAESTEWRGGSPLGIEAWRQFAAKHGKPISMPEWGLKPDGGSDHPVWIQAVNAWANKHANTATWQIGQSIPSSASGRLLYCSYFNVPLGGQTGFTIHGYGANPQSEAVFRTLRWGNNGG